MPPHRVKRPPRIEGDIAFIPLTRGKEAVIDASDLPLVGRWNWTTSMRADGGCYAYRREKRADGRYYHVLMHRVIMDAPSDRHVDHINWDGLDNRRSNLRLVTHKENMENRWDNSIFAERDYPAGQTGFRGVYRVSDGYDARIRLEGRVLTICTRETAEEAGAVREWVRSILIAQAPQDEQAQLKGLIAILKRRGDVSARTILALQTAWLAKGIQPAIDYDFAASPMPHGAPRLPGRDLSGGEAQRARRSI